MSYRAYLAIFNNEDISYIRDKSISELQKDFDPENDGYISFSEIVWSKSKLCFQISEYSLRIVDNHFFGECFFDKKDISNYFAEYNPFIINNDGFLEIIETYRASIEKMYEQIAADCEKAENIYKNKETEKEFNVAHFLFKLRKQFQHRAYNWDKESPPYSLNRNKKHIIISEFVEYDIFEIIRIYKQEFNPKKQKMVICGW